MKEFDPKFEFEAPHFVDFERLDEDEGGDPDKWFGIFV